MCRLLLFTLIFCVSSLTFAAEWYLVGLNEEVAFLVDRSTLKKVGARKEVWQWLVFGKDTSGGWDNAKTLVSYDCGNRTYQVLNFAAYNGGKLVENYTKADPPRSVIPDTVDAEFYKYICQKGLAGLTRYEGSGASDLQMLIRLSGQYK